MIVSILALWLAVSKLITLVFGPSSAQLEVEIFPPNLNLCGLQVGQSVVYTWIVLAAVLVAGLLFRFLVVPRFREEPKGAQNALEIAVEWVSGYSESTSEVHSNALSAYMLSVLALMIGCAILEMFGFRAPTSDLMLTGAMAMIAFVMFNYYGIKKKGPIGRLKSFAEPTPIVFPFELISMVSKPVSLACRLFGNMLGGMIVVDLLYVALGNYSAGIPAVVGLYFNVFHPIIQAYIFITLSLTFIREAVE